MFEIPQGLVEETETESSDSTRGKEKELDTCAASPCNKFKEQFAHSGTLCANCSLNLEYIIAGLYYDPPDTFVFMIN